MIRLLVGAKVEEAKLREPTRRHLAQSGGADDFKALKKTDQETRGPRCTPRIMRLSGRNLYSGVMRGLDPRILSE